LGKGKREQGGRGGAANQGSERTGIRAMTQRRDSQVSKGRVPRDKGRDFQATRRNYQKDWACTPVICRANCVYIMLIKDCV
jgi:hypothetical protein